MESLRGFLQGLLRQCSWRSRLSAKFAIGKFAANVKRARLQSIVRRTEPGTVIYDPHVIHSGNHEEPQGHQFGRVLYNR